VFQEVTGSMKCHYHPRAKAFAVCSVCGVGLCRKCMIEDGDDIYCYSCYADGANDDSDDFEHAERRMESEEDEDYIDLELMDVLDTDEDDGLF
jgi:hypothetical protein